MTPTSAGASHCRSARSMPLSRGWAVHSTPFGLLERRRSHGYDLKRDYDAYFGRGKPLPFGQVYATLARLARDGKAVASEAEPGAGPDRKRYTITEIGKSEVEMWLAEPIPPEPHLQTELFVKVVLSLMLGRPADKYLDIRSEERRVGKEGRS